MTGFAAADSGAGRATQDEVQSHTLQIVPSRTWKRSCAGNRPEGAAPAQPLQLASKTEVRSTRQPSLSWSLATLVAEAGGLIVVPRCAALTAFRLRCCRPRCTETRHRQRSWLYQWRYERVCRLTANVAARLPTR